jgi:hypothetical protein
VLNLLLLRVHQVHVAQHATPPGMSPDCVAYCWPNTQPPDPPQYSRKSSLTCFQLLDVVYLLLLVH